jgi:hypothetical protein
MVRWTLILPGPVHGGQTRSCRGPMRRGAGRWRRGSPRRAPSPLRFHSPRPIFAVPIPRSSAGSELLDHHTEDEIAEIVSAEKLRTGTGLPFTLIRVARVRTRQNLKPRYDRLRERGVLTLNEMAEALEVDPCTVKIWRSAGLLTAYPYTAKNECLYEPSGPDRPRKHAWKGISAKRRARNTPRPDPGGAV